MSATTPRPRPMIAVEVRYDAEWLYPYGVYVDGRLLASWRTREEAEIDAAWERMKRNRLEVQP